LLLVGYECWETLQQTCVEEEGEICTLMLFEMERAGEMLPSGRSGCPKASHQKAKACERPSIPHPHLLLAGCSPMYCRPYAPVRSRRSVSLSRSLHMSLSVTQRVLQRASKQSGQQAHHFLVH